MKANLKNIPFGTKDTLFEECEVKRDIEEKLKSEYERSGYKEVITPSLEFLDIFLVENIFPVNQLYKLTDSQNNLLVLRPDGTIPIGRVVASRLKEMKPPIKLYYNQNVFRANSLLKGKRDEITQSGVELIGISNLKADIDIIVTAINALKACISEGFSIELGNVGYFKELIKASGLDEESAEKARNYIEQKNFAALNLLLEPFGEKCMALKKLPELFGSYEVIDEALKGCEKPEIKKPLEYLKLLYEELKELGFEKYIMIDLGLINQIDYYTGIVFRGYIEGAGQTVLSGGRYDNLFKKLGRDLPAVGFAVNVDDVADSVLKNGKTNDIIDIIVFYEKGYSKKAYDILNDYIEKGVKCEMSVLDDVDGTVEYAKKRKIKKAVIVGKEIQTIDI